MGQEYEESGSGWGPAGCLLDEAAGGAKGEGVLEETKLTSTLEADALEEECTGILRFEELASPSTGPLEVEIASNSTCKANATAADSLSDSYEVLLVDGLVGLSSWML